MIFDVVDDGESSLKDTIVVNKMISHDNNLKVDNLKYSSCNDDPIETYVTSNGWLIGPLILRNAGPGLPAKIG